METRHKSGFWVDSFVIVLGVFCAALLGIGLWTIFGNDFFALNYGKLIHLFRTTDNFATATIHGKLAIFSLLCLTPIVFIRAIQHIPFLVLRIFGYIFLAIVFIALIVLYYFLATDLLSAIPHYSGEPLDTSESGFTRIFNSTVNFLMPFMMDFAYIYLWYAAPFFFEFMGLFIAIFLAKLNIPHWVKSILFGVIAIPALLATPFLIIVTGAFVGFLIGLVILIFTVTFIIGVIVSGMQPDGYAVTEDGTKLTRYGSNYYDDAGNTYTSYDGGKTVER